MRHTRLEVFVPENRATTGTDDTREAQGASSMPSLEEWRLRLEEAEGEAPPDDAA